MNKLYSLLDVKAESLTPPFCASNDEVAKRMVLLSLKNAGEVPPNQYPQDFVLMYLGDLSNEGIAACSPMRSVGNLLNIMTELASRQSVFKDALSRNKNIENSPENA